MRTLARWLFACCFVAACHEGASSDPGTRALLQVREGQFVPGELPAEGTGPEVIASELAHDTITPGGPAVSLRGTLAEPATAVVIGLEDDAGHWVVTAGAASLTEPDLPTFSLSLSFARRIDGRTLNLRFAAVDAQGRVGPYQSEELSVAREGSDHPLEVRLRWDTNADLDLHVVLPNGEEIFAGNINAQVAPPPGQPAGDPGAFRDAGQLDLDSNAGCVIDGRREERVSFPAEPARGEYVVRVATASLCGESAAHFQVEALLHGEPVGAASGFSLPQDTRFGAGRGAGAFAFSFRVP